MTTVDRIAATARQALGRRASRSGQRIDWDAVSAVRTAAHREGLDAPLGEWVRPGRTVAGLAADYAVRYSQAYGIQRDLPHVVTTQLLAVAHATR
jgi:hypothetical protein